MNWLSALVFVLFLSVFVDCKSKHHRKKHKIFKQFLKEKYERHSSKKGHYKVDVEKLLQDERKNSVLYGNPHPIHKDDWIDGVPGENHKDGFHKACNKACPKRFKCVVDKDRHLEKCVHKSQVKDRRRKANKKKHHKNKKHKKENVIIDDPELNEIQLSSKHLQHIIDPELRLLDPPKHFSKNFGFERARGIPYGDESAEARRYAELRGTPVEKPHTMSISVVDIRPNEQDEGTGIIEENLWEEKKHRGDISVESEGGCSKDDLDEMRRRLTRWFALIHAQFKEKRHLENHSGKLHDTDEIKGLKRVKRTFAENDEKSSQKIVKECKCENSVMWQLKYLDKNGDHQLDHKELKAIEQNNNEQCLKPFIQSCDQDFNGFLTKHEWCCCFVDADAESLPPCYKRIRETFGNLSSKTKQGLVMPHCDKEGYFEKEQCDGVAGHCWCVDLYGNVIEGTKKRGGAHCAKYDVMGHRIPEKN